MTLLRSVPGAVHHYDDAVAVVRAVEGAVEGIGVVTDHNADGPYPVGDIACWKLSSG